MNDAHPVPVVTLHGARSRGTRRHELPLLDFILGAGLHAIVGTPDSGTLAIAGLVCGMDLCSAGEVIVLGGNPGRDPALRRAIGTTLPVPNLPLGGTVSRLLERIDVLRGGDRGPATLGRLALSHFGSRQVSALSSHELRALELVIAVSTPAPKALVLTEPGADIAPFDRQALRQCLSEASANGACVMVITASMSDALQFADTIHLFEGGRITRWVPAGETGALVPGRGLELQVEVDYPRLLVGALADEPDVIGIEWVLTGPTAMLRLRGAHIEKLALAVARASLATGANVRSIASLAPGLEEVRAASAGLAQAAYHAAYYAWYAHEAAQVRPGPAGPPPSQVPTP